MDLTPFLGFFEALAVHVSNHQDPAGGGVLNHRRDQTSRVEDELFFGLPEPFRQSLERRALPVVVPFPGPRRGERPSAQAVLVELLQRAIGYRVRLR